MNYQTPRNTRRDVRAPSGRFRSGKLNPVMAVPLLGNEAGILSQTLTLKLDPIAGEIITPITAQMIAVYVPTQAIDALKNPDADYPGLTEVIREKLLQNVPLFDLEAEGEISRRCDIEPIRIGTDYMVCENIRLAHNAAVNHLRLDKYVEATPILGTNTSVTQALLSSTVLDMFNGVLNPDENVDGAVNLQLPDLKLPIANLYFGDYLAPDGMALMKTDNGDTSMSATTNFRAVGGMNAGAFPRVYAELNGQEAGTVNLRDFYNAETKDRLVRFMANMKKANPQYGDEMVLRWAHGLAVDPGKTCMVLHMQEQVFGREIVDAMDSAGVLDETLRSDLELKMDLLVPIPKAELGGVIITFAVVKPDETLRRQPHPVATKPWGAINFVADELALDPQPVVFRELDSECDPSVQNNVAFYTGLNELYRNYIHYGYVRNFDDTTVEAQTSVWQLEIPLSVSPENILYPEDFLQYPFSDQEGEICRYRMTSVATIRTPLQYGPTPVEELELLDENNLFEEGDIGDDLG